MSENIRVGQEVPNFKLEFYNPSNGGFGTTSLEEIKNRKKWTVLIFYPGDYTFVCPTELSDVAKKHASLAQAGAVVISVSSDSKFVHMAWQREEKLLKDIKFLMGADSSGEVAKLFGVYDAEQGIPLRGTFIIDPLGKLVASEVNFFNVGRSAQELERKLKANTYLADHPEEACPANWKEGEKTLKPGADLVGRVAEVLSN